MPAGCPGARDRAKAGNGGKRIVVSHMGQGKVTAALIVIGNEILSGRTRDENIAYLASFLERNGIALKEVRVIADDERAIVDSVTELRARYTYLFTTGGIGPTHDDITTDAIGKAFGVPVDIDSRAVAAMRRGYSEAELTPARLRMARIPQGAALIDNPVSNAPGYMIDNVVVLAGVPRIMQVMLDAVSPRLKTGRPVLTRSIRVDAPEGDVAPGLAEIQSAHPGVEIGSYPFFVKGSLGTHAVFRASDSFLLEAALADFWRVVRRDGLAATPVDSEAGASGSNPEPA
jgi:molybdenum cofactor synthesis domain-containing protein